MTILGQYTKQPVEVEIYGIQFAKDLASTDEIDSTFTIISKEFSDPWDQVTLTNPYTPIQQDNDKVIVTTSSVGTPVGVDGEFRINVSNASQTNTITVGSLSVPARGAVVAVLKNGAYVQEAKTNSILVKAVDDQRVRTIVFGGAPFEVYKVQVTVATTEGRVMQNEFIVEIEED